MAEDVIRTLPASSTAPQTPHDHARAWKVLAITSVAVFMFFLDTTVVNIAFPAIQGAFPETSRATLSWIISAYAIAFAALLVTAGRIADLAGRRRVFHAGLGLFAAASVVCGLAPTPLTLVAGRVAQAVGGAMLVPSALALLLPEFPPAKRATAVGIWSSVAAVAAAVGPPAGSALIEWAGWRWIFILNAPIALAAWLAGRGVLAESRDPGSRRPDLAGVVLMGIGMAALALGIVQGRDWGWTDGRILVSFASAGVLLPLVVVRSARHPAPVLDLSLFRSRRFAVANLASLFFGAAFFAAMLNNVLFLTEVWGYSVLRAGLAITPAPLAAAVTAALGGRTAERRGFRFVVVPGCVFAAAANLWFVARVGAAPDYVGVWLPGALAMGAGIGFGFATLGSAAATALPPTRFAVGSAVLSTARQLGAVVGVAALVAIVGTPGPAEALAAFDRGWIFSAAGCAGAALISIGLGRGTAARTEA